MSLNACLDSDVATVPGCRVTAVLHRSLLYGIDIGKTLFHVAGLNKAGRPVLRNKFHRNALLTFFGNVPTAIVAMEACPGSQWLARKLSAYRLRPHCEGAARAVRQTVRKVEQERHHRC